MKNLLRASVVIAGLVAGARPIVAAPPEAAVTGKILVLDNENTLEGDIERVGTQYRIRQGSGAVWVASDHVLKLCPDAKAAYLYLRGRANLDDADERLRLANWCRQHGLREQALAEVKEAVNLRPQHVPSKRLLDHLLQAQPIMEIAAKPAAEADPPTVPVDLTADAMGLFVTKVQPILMNTCASCHAADKGGKFKLTRSYETESANRKVMQQNLAAVLAQVNIKEPRISPLLTKAVSVHGPLAQAPLKNRQAPAFRALEEWVRMTLANNPALYEPANGASAETKAPPTPKSDVPFAADAPQPTEPIPAAPPAAAAPPTKPASPSTKPASPDPFDPAVFNRQVHPEKDTAPPKK
jgi:hypothetical protein